MKIEGAIAIVTGASSGIGLATARLLASKGAGVVMASRSEAKMRQEAKKLPNALAVECDMTNPLHIKKLVKETVKKFGQVDILVNNAGRGYYAAVADTNPKIMRELFELNVVGPVIAIQETVRVMKNHGGGMIVNISSGTALMTLPNVAVYSGAKQMLGQISATAVKELAGEGIKFMVVYPSITATDFAKNAWKEGEINWGERGDRPKADPPELVAGKIAEGIETGAEVVYVHDWMGRN